MDFLPTRAKISDILQSDTYYTIPKYQREYVWNDSKIEDLWNDIIFNMGDTSSIYFLGSFILKILQDDKSKTLLVDGQQRLTSILILLALICKHFYQLNSEFNAVQTKKYCVLGDIKQQKERARLDNEEHIVFEAIIQYCIENTECDNLLDYLKNKTIKPTKKEKQFISCYTIYNRAISDYLLGSSSEEKICKLNRLKESILNIMIVKIEVEDTKSASLAFETINARGQRLQIQDLIKNYLFMYEQDIGGKCAFETTWSKLIERIENCADPSLPRFFTTYCISKFEKCKESELFDTYKKYTPRNSVAQLLSSLDEVSEIYIHIVNGTDGLKENKELNYYLTCLNELKVTILRPLLVLIIQAFINGQIDKKSMLKNMHKIVNFFSIYVGVCSKKTNVLQNLIYSSVKEISEKFEYSKINAFVNKLLEYLPSYAEFEESLKNLAYSKHKDKYKGVRLNKNKIYYVLYALELFEQNNEDFSIPDFSIEHIKDDCCGGKACYIGNCLPLPPKKNNNLSGKIFCEKIQSYRFSCYEITRKFAERYCSNEHWDDNDIEKRGCKIAKKLYNEVWKFQ